MSESDELNSQKPRFSRRQPQTQQPDHLKCPRCESTNTKFCYYNNYNKMQPRYVCKACKRYWTKGGTLRSVPIGGERKNKRLKLPIITTSTTMTIRNNPSMDQDSLFPRLSDPKYTNDDSKALVFNPIGDEGRDDKSYIDIEELKGLVSWDFYGSFIGCTMQDFANEDLSRLGLSKLSSSFETNHGSNVPRSCMEMLENGADSTITTSTFMPNFQPPNNFLELNNLNCNDLDIMPLEDLNKPWEDPTFEA